MFKTIEEGLEVYRKKIGGHLQKTSKVAEREKKCREEQGLDYYGLVDWPKDYYEAYKKRSQQLDGMAIALGLSGEEIESIWNDIEKQLGIREYYRK
jgi:hypothetical protein